MPLHAESVFDKAIYTQTKCGTVDREYLNIKTCEVSNFTEI